jgi:hypothetical protein
MIRVRRALAAVIAVFVIAVLAACAGLPTSGPVRIGRELSEAEEDLPLSFSPDEPAVGMTPEQVVEGFIAAGSGPRDNWGVAHLFLTEDADWEPRAGVTVYTPGIRTVSAPVDGEVSVEIATEASVDATGSYTTLPGTTARLTFRLEQENGEWRISEAPDGIVLDRNRFASIFRSYSLMFFDPSWTYLVPDERWFPVEYARVRIVDALTVGGPSPWLVGSVQNAFTENTGLATASVPVRSQVAEVPLRTAARDLDTLTLNRMQTQLVASLQSAGVRSVDMLVDGQPLTATTVAVRNTRVEPRPLVSAEAGFGYLSGAELAPLPGLSAALADADGDADAIEVDAGLSAAAVRTDAGQVQRIRDDGTWATLDTRPDLVRPTLDTDGYLYSVPADQPSAVLAFGSDDQAREIGAAWPGVSRISAMSVSRDGTRLAALVRDGANSWVWVAGIVRDVNTRAPIELGTPRPLGELPGAGLALTWLDGSTLAVLAEADGQRVVIEQPVGGPSNATRAPDGAVAVAGGNEAGDVRLLDDEGRLYSQRGATWSPIANDVFVLAVQRGTPD